MYCCIYNLLMFIGLGLGLWCLTPLSTILQLYGGDYVHCGLINAMKLQYIEIKHLTHK
jgi:hypothetical protein